MTTRENLIGYACLLAGEMNATHAINYDGTVDGMDAVTEYIATVADAWLEKGEDDISYDEFVELALRRKYPAEFHFDWSAFTETDWASYCALAENGDLYANTYLGCVRVGDLCFDLFTRETDKEDVVLTYDLYVGGVDDGYGYSTRPEALNYPYTEADGDGFEDTCISMTYGDFKKMAEQKFSEYIRYTSYTKSHDLIAKASQPLHIW